MVSFNPILLTRLVIGMEPASYGPQVLASVIEIDNQNRAREVLPGQIPDPFRAIAHYDFLFRAAPATLPGFQIDALAKLFGGFDGAGVSGGIRVPDGITFLVPRSLGEHASQLDFAGVGRLTLRLARSALRLLLHNGYTSPIHLHIQDGNRFAYYHRQIQLHGSLDLPLLALRDVG